MNILPLGKKAPVYDSRDALFADIVPKLGFAFPAVPAVWGHANDFLGEKWLMYGNGPATSFEDPVPAEWSALLREGGCGDCAMAGPAHETMELSVNAGRPAPKFNTKVVVEQYSALSGYDPVSGAEDNGLYVRDVLKYRQKTGLKDAVGNVHKIGPYVSLEPKNLHQLLLALYLFECVGVGFECPDSVFEQFNRGQVWSVVPGASVVGGHYVPYMGCPSTGYLAFITWAKRAVATNAFYQRYADEAWAYVSAESIKAVTGKSYEGFNQAQLEQYLAHVASVKGLLS